LPGRMCQAIEKSLSLLGHLAKTPGAVLAAISRLKENDGSDLTPKVIAKKKVKKQPIKKEKKKGLR